MSIAADPRLFRLAAEHPHPLVFAALSGAHLYGFPSPDSDFDLRGVHLLPLAEVVGLKTGSETIARSGLTGGLDLDLVTHDIAKFCRLMLRPNGYVLEQLFSPLVVQSSPAHEQLRALGRGCITRHHVRHYAGFAATQWTLFRKEQPARIKPLLYVYRVLLTGIHLLQTGEVEADLTVLNATARLRHVDDLIARKRAGTEQGELDSADIDFHEREYARLNAVLAEAAEQSSLPARPTAAAALHDLVVSQRLARV